MGVNTGTFKRFPTLLHGSCSLLIKLLNKFNILLFFIRVIKNILLVTYHPPEVTRSQLLKLDSDSQLILDALPPLRTETQQDAVEEIIRKLQSINVQFQL